MAELLRELLHIDHWILVIWIAGALTFVVLVAGARIVASSPVAAGRFGTLVESLVEFVRQSIAEEFLGEHARRWFGFIAALFFFILFCNLLGKLPVPGFVSPTGNINVTAALAIGVFIVAQTAGILALGPVQYFKKKFLLPGPLWVQIPAIPIMFLVLLAEPFSLAVRLFANMTAGHQVVLTFATAQLVGGLWLLDQSLLVKPAAVLPFALSVILLAFELFVAFIQAFIFSLLSAVYLSESLESH